jgi:hypothetical protein
MEKFVVTLSRTYNVSIFANNRETAKHCVEFFLDDCKDISENIDRDNMQFRIEEIKPMLNEAIEVNESYD